MSYRRHILSIVLVLLSSPVFAQVTNHEPIDLRKLIKEAVVQGADHVEIPAGVYRCSTEITLAGLTNFEIRAHGVVLVKTKIGGALTISRCANVKVAGLTIDYDPPPFTQGTITAMSADEKTLELEIHAGYPALTPEMLGHCARHYFDATTRLWKEGINYFSKPQLEILASGKIRAVFDRPQTGVKPGDYIAFDQRDLNPNACVSIRDCPGRVELEDITIHAAGALAIVGRYCEDQVIFRRVKVERGPRPSGATEDRLLSSNADGVNFACCRKGPLLDQCDFSFMGDDSLNVHGILLCVVQVISPTRILAAIDNRPSGLLAINQPGDNIDVLAPVSFARVGQTICESIKILPDNADSIRKEAQLNFKSKNSITIYQIDFRQPADFLKAGQWLDFPAINCPGFMVTNSTFHDHRARGLRIQGSHGLVVGNHFERIGSSAIQIGPELKMWRESGWVRDVVVRGNTLKNIGIGGDFTESFCYTPGAIAICARTDVSRPPFPRENEDITIEGNQIDGCPASGIHAYGVKRLVIRDNTIRRTNTGDTSRTGQGFQLSARCAIELEGVSNPVVERNQISENEAPASAGSNQ